MAQGDFFKNLDATMKTLEQARQNGIISAREEAEHVKDMLSMYDAINAKKAAGREWDLKSQSIWGNMKRFSKEMAQDAENLKKSRKAIKQTEDQINNLGVVYNKLMAEGKKSTADMIKKKKQQLEIEKEIQEVNYDTAKSSVGFLGKSFNMMGKVGGFITSNFSWLGDIFKSILGTVWNIAKGLFDIIFPIEKAWKLFLELQSAVGNLSADIGMTYQEYRSLLKEGSSIYNEIIGYGGKIEDIAKIIRGFSEETGKNRIFSPEELTAIVKLGYSTGLAVDGVTKMVAEFDNLGYSLATTMKVADKGRNIAARFNLNQTKVLKTTTEVVKNLTGVGFGRSVEDLTKLAAKAETLRFNLAESINSFKDSFFSPEKAVEAAAKIQVLGGEFAQQFGDAFSLMNGSMNDADGMSERLIKSAANLAEKNSKGEFVIPPAQRQILREVADALGQNPDEMIKASVEQAKVMDKMNSLARTGANLMGFNDEDKMALSNLITMNKNGQYEIKMANGVNQLLSTITSEDQLKGILAQRKANENAAQQRLNLSERFQIVLDRFAIGLMPIFTKLNEYLEDEGTLQRIEKLGKTIADVMMPAVEALFTPGGVLDKAIRFFLTEFNTFLTDVQKIMSGEGTFFQKMQKVFGKVVGFATETILPYVKITFGEIFKALKELPFVGDAFFKAGLSLQESDKRTSDIAKSIGINNEKPIANEIKKVRKEDDQSSFGGDLLGGLGNYVMGTVDFLGGLATSTLGMESAAQDLYAHSFARYRRGTADFSDAFTGGNEAKQALTTEALKGGGFSDQTYLDLMGLDFVKEGEWERKNGQDVKKVQDAMVYANGQYIKGGKGDAVAFLDELAFGQAYKNAMGGNGSNTTLTVNVSGAIEHDSEDGKRIITAKELYESDPQMFGKFIETTMAKHEYGSANYVVNFGVTPIQSVG